MTEQIHPEDQPEATEEVVTDVVKADAKERAARTFKQGLIIAVVAAVATAALNIIGTWTSNDFVTASSWFILGTAVIQAAAMGGLSYIQRFTKTPEFAPSE